MTNEHMTNEHMTNERMTTAEMQELYQWLGFEAYMCIVKRKSDGVTGILDFDDAPRVYYNFRPV